MAGMKATSGWVITIDQRRSRVTADGVPWLLEALERLPVPAAARNPAPRWELSPERTAGDEVQAFTTDPATLIAAAWTTCGTGHWWCGIGLGAVTAPLPSSTREASGPAYLAARQAVTEAKSSPGGLILRPTGPGGAAATRLVRMMDVLADLAASSSSAVLEVCDLYDRGMTRPQVARQLGISPPAVSQRLTRRRWTFLSQTRALAIDLAGAALEEAATVEVRATSGTGASS